MTQITYTLQDHGGAEGAPDDKVFICCPACGVRIFRVSSCSNAEHLCPKCGVHLCIDVEGTMTVGSCDTSSEPTKMLSKTFRKKPTGNILPKQ